MTSIAQFPGILKWFEVSNCHMVNISPVEFACESVQAKNTELRTLINQFSANQMGNLSPLTMRLQGQIDAAVNGGFNKYKAAFFNNQFATSNPKYSFILESLAGHIA